MNYELISDKIEGNKRTKTFRNTRTGTETKIQPIYTDASGRQWWGFVDLYKIPYMRVLMTKHITDLFGKGFTGADLKQWAQEGKDLCRSTDPDKYEKLYARFMEWENLAEYTADPMKQHLALATVYVLTEEDRVDYFDEARAHELMKIWAADLDACAFFLSWHQKLLERSFNRLEKVSRTASYLLQQSGTNL